MLQYQFGLRPSKAIGMVGQTEYLAVILLCRNMNNRTPSKFIGLTKPVVGIEQVMSMRSGGRKARGLFGDVWG